MNLNQIFTFFTPKDKIFFSLFEQSGENLVEIASKLRELVNSPQLQHQKELSKAIHDLEHRGDEITHIIFTELSKNFITPFDREDIHYLTSSLDDIADYVYASSKRLQLYKVDLASNPMRELAELLLQSVIEVNAAVHALRGMKSIKRVQEAIVKIHSIENKADEVFDNAIAHLFENEHNAIELIKFRDILAHLELATDKCEDAANVIESILIKNS